MRIFLLLALIIIMAGCSYSRYTLRPPPPIEDLQKMARYDTSVLLKKRFIQAPTMLVCMQDSSSMVIWAKECEFFKNEMLYVLAESWYSPGFPGSGCHYFLINEEGTLKYTIK